MFNVALGPPNGLNPVVPHQSLPSRYELDINYERGLKKGSHMSKMAQSAYCEVCKIECNSREVLKSHKQGKKHKKNLQKLQEAITPRPNEAQVAVKPTNTEAPVAEGNALGSKKTKRKDAPKEDLETMMRRIVEEETEPNKVKVCTICIVVMNSLIVYNFHIAGSKHAAMLKKQQEAAAS
ncbi:uncharacterized protein A4U43_C07F33320 [Asparagus officinalis]|uniref:U1-type domain-containing protein n=1 Tax=Asparagus officinalis TaxID=4686 RepID=A0A5P1EH74_ASPOF|nr:uncharacterized protein A4U43_C07F33320 [Asparagus officinalis]